MANPRAQAVLAMAVAGVLVASACVGKITHGTNGGGAPTPVDPTVAANCGTPAAGHTMIHRLTNVEYNNTIRDLLYTTATPAAQFESSSIGSDGFSNESDMLTLSDQNVAEYAHAAESLADAALATQNVSGGAWQALAGCAAKTASPSQDCVKGVVEQFATRAFRRPLDQDDVDRLMAVYAGETSFAAGFHDVIAAVLIDPMFLFSYVKHPAPDDPTVTAPLDDYDLASRLSYSIWESMPDDALRALAAAGTLHTPDAIAAQVKRMLADPKAMAFALTWRQDWAHLTLLDGTSGYGGVPSATTNELRQETDLFIQDMVSNDRSIMSLVNGEQTFVNKDTVAYYGWNLPAVTASTFMQVPIPDANRRGILTQASVMLTVGGGESYTHPVQRGRWVMDSFLCSPPPPPPPGIPSLDSEDGGTNLPMRDRLNAHVSSPACMGCHATMDVYGLALENFDLTGKWRNNYPELGPTPIDVSGILPNGGGTFTGPSGMIALLADNPQVQTCLTQKLMAYSLARPMASADDLCVAKAVGQNYASSSTHLSDLFAHVATSPQFLNQQGVAQ